MANTIQEEEEEGRGGFADHMIITTNGCDKDDPYVELTIEICDDFVAVHGIKASGSGVSLVSDDDDEETLLAATERFSSSFGSSIIRSASSSRFKLLPSFNKRTTKYDLPRFDRTNSAASSALKGLKFITKTDNSAGWLSVQNRFNDLTANSNGLLPRSLFGECIGMNKESKEFSVELFDALCRRRRKISGGESNYYINKTQLKEYWDQISNQSFYSRLETFFDMVDKNADGRITQEDVKEIISLSASANKLSNIHEQAEEYAALIMEELDPHNLGYIMIQNLEMLLLEAPNNQSIRRRGGGGESRYLSQVLSQKLKPTREANPFRRWYQKSKYFILDNWQRIWVFSLWIGIMSGLFAYKFFQYRRHKAVYHVMGNCVCIAKGVAETLKFNMALILLPVCRNTITFLRNRTNLGLLLPFDDNLNFHKIIAVGIVVGVVLHVGAHLTCDFPRLLHVSTEEYESMKPYFGNTQPQNFWWFLKGIEGVSGIIMVVLMGISFTLATPWFRRNKIYLPRPFNRLTGYNMFWYSHHMFVIVYALLIVHGIKLYLTKEWYKKTTWMYLAVPVIVYTFERLIRALRSSIKPVKICKVAVHPGNVLALYMSKPQGFRYKSGQYMFLNCSDISPFEWHPFSITSAPGDDYLSVHIRTLGDWTRQLLTVFSQVCQPPTVGKSRLRFPGVLIDGPYGAPAQEYKNYEVVLLVGLGIGATPMISIVKDIVNNMKAIGEEKEEEEYKALENDRSSTNNNTTGTGGSSKSRSSGKKKEFKTRKAYFYWVTREQGSFDWFKGVMNEVADMDQKGVIELHSYCTSVYEENDARSALIAMLQSINHAKHGFDVVSGTRVKSHFGKPNWRNVYKRIALNHENSRVGVFYCGAPALTKELGQMALDFSRKTTTKFDFHKENF